MNYLFKCLLITFSSVWIAESSIYSAILPFQTTKNSEENGQRISNERIYLHTDREIYIAGDPLFFKAYLYDEGLKKLSVKSKIAYMIICDSKNEQIIQQSLVLTGGTGYGCVAIPDTLKTGTYKIIAYTNWMRNFGESTFFHKQIIITNRFDEELVSDSPKGENNDETGSKTDKYGCLTISTDHVSYLQREKVTLKLSLPANKHANVSISVAEKQPEKYDNTTIMETLSSVGKNVQRSDAFRTFSSKTCEYLAEDNGLIISGVVNNPSSRSGIIVTLTTPDTIANLKYSITNTSGKFFFQLDRFYSNKDLYISILDQSKVMESALIIDDKYALNPYSAQTESFISNQTKKFIRKSQTIASINKTYKKRSVINEIESTPISVRRKVYYVTDHRVLLTDYVPLNNFSEIITETLPYIRLRKKILNYEIEIIDSENKIFLKNPAVFVNGMLVNNINCIMNFGSDKIRRIETICHPRTFGSLEFNGIMSVFTSPDVKNDLLFDKQSVHIPPITFLSRSQFSIPEYSTSEKILSRSPDFRQLLYWNPSVEIPGTQPLTLEFYTSDNKGRYIVKIEGIASDGSPLSCTGYFDVR
jgi:hypothetical protein